MLNDFPTIVSSQYSMFEAQCSKFNVFQWLNKLAIDAVFIAICWQAVFASMAEMDVHFAAACVLGLSVWLTYTADRLFDVAQCPVKQLHSIRHRFAKRNAKTLWKVWFGALAINACIAFAWLTTQQLLNGALLLIFCLLYTLLNQKLSSRFFPKEFCVAIIYASGVIVFLLPAKGLWLPSGFLMLLCFINCLIISHNEHLTDAAMKVRSIAQFLPKLSLVLYALCLSAMVLLKPPWLLPLGTSLAALALMHLYQNKLSVESFRILADAALFIGPLITLLFAFA